MNNVTATLYVDYVYLDAEERKQLNIKSRSCISSIPANHCYRDYKNFDILFIEEKIADIKYSSYKHKKIKKNKKNKK